MNSGNASIALYPGSRIAQMIFMHVEPGKIIPITGASKYFGMTEPGFTKLHDEHPELEKWKQIGKHISFQTGKDSEENAVS